MSDGEQPFEELGEIQEQLRQLGSSTVDVSIVNGLAEAANHIQTAHQTAVEMQRGAEGFDNTHEAALYSTVQMRLLAAARELVEAARPLRDEAETWARFQTPKE